MLGSVRVPALVIYREDEYLRDATRYMGERLPGARIVAPPGVDHLPWEGDQAGVLDEIERFLAGVVPTAAHRRRRSSPRCWTRSWRRASSGLLESALARFRGRALDAPPGASARASTAPRARCGARPRSRTSFPALRAGVHTGECELHDGMVTGAALEVAAAWSPGSPPRARSSPLSTVHDLVAGSGIFFADNSGTAGELRLFSVLRCPPARRARRGCGRWCRSGARR